jgi:hypothetical protein
MNKNRNVPQKARSVTDITVGTLYHIVHKIMRFPCELNTTGLRFPCFPCELNTTGRRFPCSPCELDTTGLNFLVLRANLIPGFRFPCFPC